MSPKIPWHQPIEKEVSLTRLDFIGKKNKRWEYADWFATFAIGILNTEVDRLAPRARSAAVRQNPRSSGWGGFTRNIVRIMGFSQNIAVLLIAMLMTPSHVEAFERFNRVREFDPHFIKYSKRFFGPAFDWRYFKAQAIAESSLKPEARSRVGAVGLMQIMPATFKEITRKWSYIKGSGTHPRWNVAAGIYYDRLLWKTWKAERPFEDRLAFMYGSFNAGKMNIIKAQRRARGKGLNPNLWQSVVSTLPSVTGKRSKETITYIDKINKIKEVLR